MTVVSLGDQIYCLNRHMKKELYFVEQQLYI